MTSPYVNASGTRLTKQLFVEHQYINPDSNLASYTMLHEDKTFEGIVYPSLYRLYMEANDITEATFVERYLHDWEQWTRLCSSAFFRDEVAQWREQLRKKVEGQLVERLVHDALNVDSKTHTSSAKYLLDRLDKKAGKRVGRPTKEQSDDPNTSLESVRSDLEWVVGAKGAN